MNKNNFDIIRFLLASIVLFRHNIDLSQNLRLKPFAPFLDSHASVTCFFIISGFLIWRSYSISSNSISYFSKRARRLLPAYLVFIISAILILSFFSRLTLYEYFSDINVYKYFVSNIFFLNFLQPCLPGVFTENFSCAVNGALWTIKIEVLFYVIVPVIFHILDKSKYRILLICLIYFLSVSYKTFFETYESKLAYLLSKQTPGFMSYFIIGVSFYYYFDFYRKNKIYLSFFSVMVIAFERLAGIEIFSPFALGCVLFFLAYSCKYFNSFGKLGDFSYGIYIYHFLTIQLAVERDFFNIYNPFLVILIIYVIVLSISVLSWYFIEKPFLKKRGNLSRIVATG